MDADTRPSLLKRVRDPADQQAWREFERCYGDLVLRYALARRLQHCDAEDLRQVVFLKLSRYLRGFEYSPQRGRFRDYLGVVTRNAVFEFLARPVSRPAAVEGDVWGAFPDPNSDALDEVWEREWENHHYRLALATVRRTFEPRSVEAFDRLLAGAAAADVAASLGMSLEAVTKARQRVRARLGELIAAQVREEDQP